MAEVSIEHKRELKRTRRSPEQRQAELVHRLLAGQHLGTTELGYDLDGWHLGVIATGLGAREALSGMAKSADRQLLSVSHGEETVWAWLGGKAQARGRRSRARGPRRAGHGPGAGDRRAGGGGFEGWRPRTHRQAQAARLVALHRPSRLTRYAEDMLLAAALRDETLAKLAEGDLSRTAHEPARRWGGVAADAARVPQLAAATRPRWPFGAGLESAYGRKPPQYCPAASRAPSGHVPGRARGGVAVGGPQRGRRRREVNAA